MNNEYFFNDVMQRLKNITNASSYNALAAMMGLSSSAFANFKKRNSIPYNKVFALANSLNISADWVLTGEGDVHRNAKNESFLTPHEKALLANFRAVNEEGQKEILLHAGEKKRMRELETVVAQLQKKMG